MLPDRGVVRVAGEDAEKLLQGVVTNDMDLLATRPAIHAALLTPQGKILFEFFVVKAGEGNYLLETGRRSGGRPGQAARHVQAARQGRRSRTRAAEYRVLALWGDAPASLGETTGTVSFPDPRLPALGMRILAEARFATDIASATNGMDATPDEYHAHRIALGVPEAGKDYALGDTFPHEADMDQLGGVSFSKGCFVGQEVVSRMQHRAHVRKRVVPIDAVGAADLQSGAEVMAGAAAIGKVGSVAGRQALALLRLDRAAEAKAKGEPLTAGGVAIALRKPDWATLRSRARSRRGDVMSAAELIRCPWSGIADSEYARYHDEEWGVPKTDDRALFEKIVLEGFQSGLSWLTILRKRDNFRRAFDDFDAARIARYRAKDIARLMADAGIVRNKLKIEATIDNARALLKLQERTSLAAFLWGFIDGRPQINEHRSFKASRRRRRPPRRSPRR